MATTDDTLLTAVASIHELNARVARLERAIFGDPPSGGGTGPRDPKGPSEPGPLLAGLKDLKKQLTATQAELDGLRKQVRELQVPYRPSLK